MRLFSALVLMSLAGAAQADSIEQLKALPKNAAVDSVIRIGCGTCPPPAPKKAAYAFPTLKSGQQKVELKTVNGEQKVFRTDAWIGGSPVTYVSTATKEDIAALEYPARHQNAQKGDGVDPTATTAAVGRGTPPQFKAPVAADMTATPAPAIVPPKALDTSSFTLRQN